LPGIKAVKLFFLCLPILLTASPALAQKLPNWLEKQVRSGSLSQQEAVLLWKGNSNTPQTLIPTQKAMASQKSKTQETSSQSSKATNIMSPGCPDVIVSDIKARFPYDTIVEGPRFGPQQYTEMLEVVEGNVRFPRNKDSDSFYGRFLAAIKESAPFTRPQCGHPSGTLTVSAKNSRNSIDQWSLEIELVNSTLK
jgi:hypothetical protein